MRLDATDVTDVTKNLPATEPAPPDSERDQAPPPSQLPSRYRFIDRIASGSFGEIQRVHDTVLDRELAMKVLRWEYIDDRRVRARFLAEAQITAKLQHPGIVAVHDRGELEDRRLWYTMKVVDGRTLGAVIREVHAAAGPDAFRATASGWTFRRLIDAFARISQAVGYAHSCQVMHRDLKPENIMTGPFGEVLVMDWGIARYVGEAGEVLASTRDAVVMPPPMGRRERAPPPDAETRILPETKHGEVIGTPAYMSPEQARGQRDLHRPPSDVYALGAILHHLLTGRPPYEGDSNLVWHRVLAGPPRSIAEASRGGPPVPLALVAIAERAMQREIEDRYPDAEKLAQEVLTWLDEDLRRAWKIHRDVGERGHPLETVLKSMERRSADAQRYIHPQRPKADLVLKLRPVNMRQMDNVASPKELTLKLTALIRSGTYHERLARMLIGICGLHLDIELAEDSDEVEMTIEGEVSAEDIALAAGTLAPNLQEMLDIRPQWEDGMTGIMQLMVLLQIEESLKNRIR